MLLLSLILGYLIGSIPWGLIVGKLFFNKDIRQYGSGNLGGTNAGRVLGKYYGFLVVFLDALKAFAVVYFVSLFSKDYAVLAGMMCAIGHCYPLFAEFRGGKAVASTFGYLLAVGLFVTGNHIVFSSALISFLITLLSSSMVSLASLVAVVIASVASLFQPSLAVGLCTLSLTLLIVYRHRSNIKRILKNEENKIKIFKKE
ncbi:MAG: glycerol-3-phosphate 1-O-acyltransferase PlsY [Erysipelotrichaceae bacterium]|nr:glycerol-3-phosphate 1-O-acyltransferase PlsY [Erysipelotrichaceae bacterium]